LEQRVAGSLLKSAFFAVGQFHVLFGQGPILSLDVHINRSSRQLDTLRDVLKKRIAEAAQFMPIEQLYLSPQCGFASSARSRPLPMDLTERKLARIVEVADQVWG
jgi:hypothetical protein